MSAALQFKPLVASVFLSQTFEEDDFISKQSVLSGVGLNMRNTLSQLEPDVTVALLSEYKDPDNSAIQRLEASLIEREMLVSIDENTLDTGYFNSQAARRMEDLGIGPDDEWNGPSMN